MRQGLYERLVEYIIQNQDKFYRLAYSYVRNQEDALDVVQNAVCKALEKYDTIRNENAVKTWFCTILTNESLTLLREKKRIVLDETITDSAYEEKGFELFHELHNQLDRLEEDEQSIIRLRFFEELSLDEIAEVMRMNPSTVKSKLYRGLKKLRVVIQREEESWKN